MSKITWPVTVKKAWCEWVVEKKRLFFTVDFDCTLSRKLISVILVAAVLTQASFFKMFFLLCKCWISAELIAGCLSFSLVCQTLSSSASKLTLLAGGLPTHNLVWHLASWLMDVWEYKLKSINSLCRCTVNSIGRDKAPECRVNKIFSNFLQHRISEYQIY